MSIQAGHRPAWILIFVSNYTETVSETVTETLPHTDGDTEAKRPVSRLLAENA